ncbi:lytic polysaccharide monooxygenase [uncultured Aquimarina sp.]|uniref:lytic polysaccharide monooxygenase n=1 Tax=uncultured Aquimarina sp. TaxID=575652 RepID=UPI002639B325|nr:lytic polysaccharide monooxygenase [uncultured Aquimarina sp.]
MKNTLKYLFLLCIISIIEPMFSHGTVIWPPSRIYNCYNNPSTPVCQPCGDAIYNWMGVLQPDTDYGKHQVYVPDGQIASGGNGSGVDFGCLDALTTDWASTTVDHGYIDVKWQNTAPHKTEYYKVYITPLNWDPTMPLKWNDLIEIGHRGKGPAESFTIIRSFIPDSYAGKRAALISVWQRDFNDSHEAFYSVSDILVSGSDGGDGGDGGDSSDCNDISPWSVNNVYWGGDSVNYLNTIYKAKWWTKGDKPTDYSDTNDVWENKGSCESRISENSSQTRSFSLVKCISSPINNEMIIQYHLDMPKKLTMTIRNLSNQILITEFSNKPTLPGKYEEYIVPNNISPGIYLCVLEDEIGVLKSLKIIVKK